MSLPDRVPRPPPLPQPRFPLGTRTRPDPLSEPEIECLWIVTRTHAFATPFLGLFRGELTRQHEPLNVALALHLQRSLTAGLDVLSAVTRQRFLQRRSRRWRHVDILDWRPVME